MKKNLVYLNLAVVVTLLFFLLTPSVLAQTQGITNPVIGDLGTNDPSVSSGGRFIQYTVYLWRASITLGSLAVIAFFLLGAFEWITSGGDKTKVENARNKITSAVIGLVLLVSSFVLLSFLSKLLFAGEFDLLKLTVPGIN
ncbi:hypothetical protein KBB59_01175 [Candidatus Woesebacteria bacterium]|jgi:hypothetical protein|nr:hypothetical protein [Candidatus Woesebacteria bacterium]HOA11763.1 hypothetical protein [Candidatus Woesebacteria bacterium]HOC07450.1 hypothetical protein [Candidatus Woesebacteria bacterium]HOI04860.1 hypothetical protein [Candidatus Woesebacteria bacterium]HOP38848.1 hypothetical protein [Candidatus Woesebacteria bacterium]